MSVRIRNAVARLESKKKHDLKINMYNFSRCSFISFLFIYNLLIFPLVLLPRILFFDLCVCASASVRSFCDIDATRHARVFLFFAFFSSSSSYFLPLFSKRTAQLNYNNAHGKHSNAFVCFSCSFSYEHISIKSMIVARLWETLKLLFTNVSSTLAANTCFIQMSNGKIVFSK